MSEGRKTATELLRRIVQTGHRYAVLFAEARRSERRFCVVYKSDIEVVCRSVFAADEDRDFLTAREVLELVESLGAADSERSGRVRAAVEEILAAAPLDRYCDLCALFSDPGPAERRCPPRLGANARRRSPA